MPSSKPERTFKSSIKKGKKQLRRTAKFNKEMFGESPEEIKKSQTHALSYLYKRQRLAVLAIFCLVRSDIKTVCQIDKNPHATIKSIKIPPHVLGAVTSYSCLKPTDVVQEFMNLTEEEAIQKLRKIMDDIFFNCAKIGKKLKLEFNPEKHGELNTGLEQ